MNKIYLIISISYNNNDMGEIAMLSAQYRDQMKSQSQSTKQSNFKDFEQKKLIILLKNQSRILN